MAKYCSKCGVMLTEGAVFCSSCGARVELSVPPVQASNQYQFQQTVLPQKKSGGILKLAIFFILASVLVVAIYTLTKSTPEKTLHKFEKSYNDMDFDKMLECMEPSAQSVFEGAQALLSGFTGYDVDTILEGVLGYTSWTSSESRPSVKFKSVDVNYLTKKMAEVSFVCTYFDGEDYEYINDSMQMVKQDGKWYISVMGNNFY